MSQLEAEIERLKTKVELIKLASRLAKADQPFKANLVGKVSKEVLAELASGVKAYLDQYAELIEKDVDVKSLTTLTSDDIIVLKALAQRLADKSKLDAPPSSALVVENKVASKPVQQKAKQVVIKETPTKAEPITSYAGRSAILLDSTSVLEVSGPGVNGTPAIDCIVPGQPVAVLRQRDGIFDVRQGNIKFSVPAECLEF